MPIRDIILPFVGSGSLRGKLKRFIKKEKWRKQSFKRDKKKWWMKASLSNIQDPQRWKYSKTKKSTKPKYHHNQTLSTIAKNFSPTKTAAGYASTTQPSQCSNHSKTSNNSSTSTSKTPHTSSSTKRYRTSPRPNFNT